FDADDPSCASCRTDDFPIHPRFRVTFPLLRPIRRRVQRSISIADSAPMSQLEPLRYLGAAPMSQLEPLRYLGAAPMSQLEPLRYHGAARISWRRSDILEPLRYHGAGLISWSRSDFLEPL
ncbi:unnamed protein product, partial [Nesidiocoris tenuis]